MTPGKYLRSCRERAGVALALLAAEARTEPHQTPEHLRRAWLARVEADDVPITADVVAIYRARCPLDASELAELMLVHAGLRREAAPEPLELTPAMALPPAIGAAA